MFNRQESQEPKTNTIIYLHRVEEFRSSHTPIGSVDVFMTATPQVGDSINVTFDVYHNEFRDLDNDNRSVRGYGEVTNVEWTVGEDRVLKAWINVLVKYAYLNNTLTSGLLFDDEDKKEVK